MSKQETSATLYDWSTAPDWANWAAMDSDGSAQYYGLRPKIQSELGFWYDSAKEYKSPCKARVLKVTNWNNSLEQRPTDKDAVLPSEKQI